MNSVATPCLERRTECEHTCIPQCLHLLFFLASVAARSETLTGLHVVCPTPKTNHWFRARQGAVASVWLPSCPSTDEQCPCCGGRVFRSTNGCFSGGGSHAAAHCSPTLAPPLLPVHFEQLCAGCSSFLCLFSMAHISTAVQHMFAPPFCKPGVLLALPAQRGSRWQAPLNFCQAREPLRQSSSLLCFRAQPVRG